MSEREVREEKGSQRSEIQGEGSQLGGPLQVRTLVQSVEEGICAGPHSVVHRDRESRT